jgi:hypothetical protein
MKSESEILTAIAAARTITDLQPLKREICQHLTLTLFQKAALAGALMERENAIAAHHLGKPLVAVTQSLSGGGTKQPLTAEAAPVVPCAAGHPAVRPPAGPQGKLSNP